MNGLSKNYYPQGQSNTEKNCGRTIKPLVCSRLRQIFEVLLSKNISFILVKILIKKKGGNTVFANISKIQS